MVLALATFLVAFGATAGAPAAINYVVECFPRSLSAETTAILNFDRLVFGLAIPFFIFPWADKVGNGWVFGMMAFFTLFSFAFIVALMIWGLSIRRHTFISIGQKSDGDGVRVLGQDVTGSA